ncbi:DNA polymerase III subunit alpha [Spiroplasma platyhelix]|uniref:DNA-directed DNA polymerase n=1 Tax=Spiroplasma platyhelix PALS-1 TaxID=1276218 RepID=A0A846TRP9_9MOLU|nr:DNA polymerase III subunit alpha [Spiroplasma platyhelix]MBE4703812.1 DNA polymerase III subunit alpha [Spiroplasma platyhelix PALS-1]NKE38185.1 DNA polymerase III subunit alpha [Spiroplasma platyhelix PALS-1]UJB29070.1 DNA polymerase III subunit alpha [Spiroplasma platyhelix PALS-1]
MKYLVNLNVHSNYSFLSSSIKLKDYLSFAKKNNLASLVLTDSNVMYGAYEFYQLCQQHNIKPIIGLDCQWKHQDILINLSLLSINYLGYKTLIKISTFLNTKSPFLTDLEIAAELVANSNLIVIIKVDELEPTFLKETWNIITKNPDDETYFGVTENNIKKISDLTKLTKKILATNLVEYINSEDAEILQVLTAIKDNKILKTNELVKSGSNYYKNEVELKKVFPDWILANNEIVISKCNLDLPKLTNQEKLQQLPKFSTPNSTSTSYLKALCKEGLEKRFKSKTINQAYITRLLSELAIINLMGFNDYFLIVQDYITFAKKQGIIVGPGRGSVAGSLVAYVLEITDVDPIKYDLIFERFLNPERTSLPDIDIDFQDERREEVIQYLGQKYGLEHVSHIVTFQTIASKMAVRDLGRVFNISLEEINEISKLILTQYNFDLSQAITASPKLQLYVKKYPMMFDVAQKILGFPRQTSTHAAGIILANQPLVNLLPLQTGFNNIFQTQYAMQELESIGLIKMDILGLRNLTILNKILEQVEKYYNIKLDLNQIPLNDAKTFKIIANGDTTGIFQLESQGMREILKAMEPNNLEDIIATTSLFRPGPQDYIETYIRRKLGKEKVTYVTLDLEPYLKSTYGIIVYQEQILLILQKIAGFTLAKADLIRRAISKKDLKVMNQQETLFIESALKQGYNQTTVSKIWDDIKQFAGYGFNRSHAVAYTLISYWLGYLKANYPLAFMSCLLTSAIGNDQKLIQYLHECQKYNIKIFPPDVNKSNAEFMIDKKNNALIYSLQAIKQMSLNACQLLVTEREKNGLFTDFFNFCARAIFVGLNRKNIEYLIAAGAFDELNNNRTTLIKNLDNAFKYANIVQIKDLNTKIVSLNLKFQAPILISYPNNWNANSINEYKALGLYLKYNPEKKWKAELDKQNQTISLTDVNNYVNQTVKVISKIISVKTIKTKNNQLMAFLMVENNNIMADVTVFNNVYQYYQDKLQTNKVVLMEVKVENYQSKIKLVLNKVLNSL